MNFSLSDSRAKLLRVVTFLGGIYFFLYFLTPDSAITALGIKDAHEAISNGFIVVGSMAIGLGIINIVTSHGSRVIFLKKSWPYSIALLLGLLVMIGVTIGQWLEARSLASEINAVQIIGEFATRIVDDAKATPGEELSYSPNGVIPPINDRVAALISYTEQRVLRIRETEVNQKSDAARSLLIEERAQALSILSASIEEAKQQNWSALRSPQGDLLGRISIQAAKLGAIHALIRRGDLSQSFVSRLYEFLYNGLFNQLGSSMFALLGVYIAAAAYRAFRIRTVESALMMGAALVVMLGQISFGKMIYSDMSSLRQWLLEVPNSAAFRAIRLGAGVAGLMLAIRMWLSIDSSSSKRDSSSRGKR